MSIVDDFIAERGVLLADGATGTNLFDMGLESGYPPELWNVEHPDRIRALYNGFLSAGSDIILTNSFGGNSFRMKLHQAEDRIFELNKASADLARECVEACDRSVLVAGSVGPTGELFEPLGALTMDSAIDAFVEQMEGLKAGGVDIIWIETMSAEEEILAAAEAARRVEMPYCVTASFDTAGRTMMGLEPSALPTVFQKCENQPSWFGSNCGVGASDLVLSVTAMAEADPNATIVAKANCGIPQVRGDGVHYTGTPELMADYVRLAIDAGAKVIGGCCGTTFAHIAAMREAIDTHTRGTRPDRALIEAKIGPLVSPPNTNSGNDNRSGRRRSRRTS